MTLPGASLTVTGLGKRYEAGVGVVSDIDFDLAPGTFFTLLGPSGCGKTTTLRCIAGLEQPQEGTIHLDRAALFDAARNIDVPMNRRNFGMVFQSYAIWPHLTVFENVAFPLRVSTEPRFDKAAIHRMVDEALDSVGLLAPTGRSATRLSGGQQQRVALARAVVRRPRLLLLDEPLSNLDAVLREEMRVELKRLQQQLGLTTIYVTHDQSEALEMSDTVAVLNRGRLVQVGPPEEIYFRPADSFVAGFMGSPNIIPVGSSAGAAAGSAVQAGLATGGTLVCSVPHAIAAGKPMAVSIRAEDLRATPPGSALPDGVNRLQGTVQTAGFQGQSTRYVVDCGGLTLHATGPSVMRFGAGDAVLLDSPVVATRPCWPIAPTRRHWECSMKIAFIDQDSLPTLVAVVAGGFIRLDVPGGLRALLGSPAALASAQAVASGQPDIHADGARYLPFLDPAARAFCAGMNYQAHAMEHGREKPKPEPGFFIRVASSLVGHGTAIHAPKSSAQYDFEGELCVVIGKPGRHIAAADAMAHVAGYTCLMDGSVRDYQKNCAAAGKNFDASGSVGPWMVTADKVPDVTALQLRTMVNGVEMQHSSLDRLIHPIPKIIAYLSTIFHLQPGDLIATGSPEGVGQHRQPPAWLKSGDTVTVEIPGVGTLSNHVVAEV